MYSNGETLAIVARERQPAEKWRRRDDAKRIFKTGKKFVRCKCPKCGIHHHVYMLWTGRGVPRKYCGNCKPLVSGYDAAVLYEAAVYAPGHSKKKGRRHEGE
jgi:hypothetical protein